MGDDEGFHEFVSSRSPALLRTAYLLLGDWELAEDLVQTALAQGLPALDAAGRVVGTGVVDQLPPGLPLQPR